MKKYFVILALVITTLFIISCSPAHSNLPPAVSPSQVATAPTPQTPVSEQLPKVDTTQNISPPPPSSTQPAKEIIPEPKTQTSPPETVKSTPALAAQIRNTPAVLPPTPLITAFDQFTGSTIDSTKYNTKITGNASLIQNDQIIMQGNSDNGISWASLYTTKIYNVQEEYNLSVDINFTGSATSGSANAVLSLENLPILTGNKNPDQIYCELSISRDDKILRMSKTISHLELNTPMKGTLNFFWSKKLGKATCTFNGQTITQYQEPQTGEYYGALRSGLNYMSKGGGIETSGTGDYMVIFDNFFIKQN